MFLGQKTVFCAQQKKSRKTDRKGGRDGASTLMVRLTVKYPGVFDDSPKDPLDDQTVPLCLSRLGVVTSKKSSKMIRLSPCYQVKDDRIALQSTVDHIVLQSPNAHIVI